MHPSRTPAVVDLALAAIQPLATQWAKVTGRGVPETERARRDEGPLTPVGGAFVIWAPIFGCCLLYALKAPDARLPRAFGRTAFVGNVLWSLNAQLRGLGWTSVALISASAASATLAVAALERSRRPGKRAHAAASLLAPLAGWLSVASIANVETTMNGKLGRPEPERESRRARLLLVVATAAAAAGSVASRGNLPHAAAASWGLGGIVLKNLRRNGAVAATAAIGLAVLVGTALLVQRNDE